MYEWLFTVPGVLDGAQGLRRGGVARQDHQGTAPVEKLLHGLERELVDHVERARAIWSAGIVAQIQVIILRKQLAYLAENRQTAVAGIENAYLHGSNEYIKGKYKGRRLIGHAPL